MKKWNFWDSASFLLFEEKKKHYYTKPRLNKKFITNFSNKGYKPNIFK